MTSFAKRLLLSTCVAALGFAYACGDDAPAGEGDDHEHDHDASGHEHDHDAATADGGDPYLEEEVPCDAAYPSFTPGMSVKAGELTVKVQAITPAPPRQKTRNDWTVQVSDAAGQPVSGLTFLNPASYMPVHRHGGKTPPVVSPGTEPGTYKLERIDFIMRGPWQVLFDLQQNGATVGKATVQICVE
ncbi:MAG: hypothetical protein ABW352_17210 [Polyangiales bacterium]